MSIDYLALGKSIAEKRNEAGLTQEQLAEKVGVTYSHIGNIERGKAVPSLDVFVGIFRALETSADYLLFNESVLPGTVAANELASLLGNCDKRQAKIIMDTIKTLYHGLTK